MKGSLKDMSDVVVYLDDILITGKSQTEHLENLGEVVKRVSETEFRLRKDKVSVCEGFCRVCRTSNPQKWITPRR